MLCLQEIKATRDHIPKTVGDLPGYWCYWHGTKGYSGVALHRAQGARGRTGRCTFIPTSTSRRASRRCAWRARWSRRSTCPTAAKDFAAQGALPRGDGGVRRPPCARPAIASCCAATSTSRARSATCIRGSATTALVGQRPDERALFERILDAGALHDVGREQDPSQRRALHLVGAVAQHAPAQHRLAPRLRARERAARRADVALRVDARIRHQRSRARGGDVRRRGAAVMIIVSDFDGTLTLDDVTTYIWDKYLPYDWRAKLLPPTYEGRWTPLEMIGRGYARHPRPAQGAARGDPRQHPACGPASRRWRRSAAVAAGTSPSSATGSRST